MKRRLFAPPSRDLVQKQQFRHEVVYCEFPHTPQDVLCYGSDEDADDDPIDRQLRIEHHANRFLHGRPMLIASATLHGPFGKDSGWRNPWRSRLVTPSQPQKRLRLSEPNFTPDATTTAAEPSLVQPNPHATTTTGAPRHHQPNRVSFKSGLYVSSPELLDNQASTSGHAHVYLDNANFSRVRSWRDEVVNEAHVAIPEEHDEEKTPRPEPTPITNRLPHYVPTTHLSASLRVVGDSFDSSQIVHLYSPQKQTPNTLQKSATPHIPLRQPERERATSSLRNYSSYATTPAKESPKPQPPAKESPKSQPPAKESPEPMQPQPQPRPNEQADQPVLKEALEDPSSSELSEPSQFSQDIQDETVPLEDPVSSSKSAARTGKESAVAAAKHLDAIRLQDFSDRSFRFRSAVPLPDPDSEVQVMEIITTQTLGQKEAEKTGQNLESPKRDMALPPCSMSAYSHKDLGVDIAEPEPDHENVQLPEESIVVDIEPESPEATESHNEHAEVHATNASRIDTDGDAFIVDGPVLAPSTVSSDSELSELASMGNFSSEKQSQNLPEANSMPRKLLWPKSEKDTTDTSVSSDPSIADAEKDKGSQRSEKERLSSSDPAVQPYHSPGMPEEAMVGNAIHDTPAKALSQHVEVKEDDIEQDEEGVCASLGAPLSERHEQQSSVRSSQIGVRVPNGHIAGPIEDVHPVNIVGPVSPSANASPEHLPNSQSPWVNEPTPVQTLKVPEQAQASPIQPDNTKLSVIASHVLDQVSQSPWAKGDSQIAAVVLPDTRLFNPISSPAKSTSSPLQEITLPNLPLPQSPCSEDASMAEDQSCPPMPPSTPELKRSNLPTPEYTHSIKSFREFMTPSPQKPRPSKIRRISSVNEGHFPSTQVLVDAAVSNPWLQPSQSSKQKTSRKRKHVSWGPLPGQEDISITVATSPLAKSPPGGEFPEGPEGSTIPRQPRPILRSSRATSPPLQSLPKNLPAEQEKFGKHFAAMVNRRTVKPRSRTVMLPSALQQSSGSPQVEAMAERFLSADKISTRTRAIGILSDDESLKRKLEGIQPRSVGSRTNTRSSLVEPEQEPPSSAVQSLYENRTVIDTAEDEEGEELVKVPGVDSQVEAEVDPVEDVMQNLDGFFENTWQIEDSGLFSKAGENPSRNSRGGSRLRSSGIGRFSSSAGAMDTGIWD